ncbi:MAG: peptidoglycan DD-metalloendopeptidase family protein [Lentilitoribacter sp.]
MSNFKLSQPQRVVLKTLSAVFLAGTVAGCSSDLSRFSYYQAVQGDGLTTASVKTPHAGSLAPVGVGTQSFPGDARQPVRNSVQQVASAAPQQAYPGDIYSPAQNTAPLYTASIPTNQPVVNQSATPLLVQRPAVTAPIVSQPIAAAVPVIKQPLEAPKRTPLVERVRNALTQKKKQSLENTVQSVPVQTAAVQRMPVIRPIAQPNVDTQIVTGAIASNTAATNIVPMAPDPMVTGSIPNKAKVSRGGWSTANGARVTLREGETVYNLSRRYGVPAAEILDANDIRDSRSLKVGQSLIIPTYVYSQAATVSAPDNDQLTKAAYSHKGSRTLFPKGAAAPVPASRIDTAMLAPTSAAPTSTVSASPLDTSKPVRPAAPSTAQTISTGQYTVASGDTLNRIAYKNGVSVEALKAANNIKTSNIRIGQKLVIPSKSFKSLSPDQTTTASVTKVDPKKTVSTPVTASTSTKNDKITETAKVDSNVAAPAKTGISKLRWPAKGQIASSFGGKTDDGKRNDGLDILMPEGSAIKAAENGVVIYASNGLKGYGNTVLVRHDGDIVTVYAHAKSLNVKRGDKVQRGQVIAQSGMTGSAKRPKLHFEVRKNATPQNPITFLE